MRLNKIVLSGANEFTDAGALAEFGRKHELAEIGIQVSGDKAFFGSARYWWLHTLTFYVSSQNRLALHLNKDWAEAFCAGKIFLNSGITMENRFLKEYSLISKSDGKKRRIWIHCWQQ